jgi:hypothetical protein
MLMQRMTRAYMPHVQRIAFRRAIPRRLTPTRIVAVTAWAAMACAPAGVPPVTRPLASAIAVDTAGGTVTLPLHAGFVGRRLVWYIVTESSDRADAARRGVTWAPRLAALAASAAAQAGTETSGVIHYSAGIRFTAGRVMRANPDSGFPALEARPGSVGENGYSPFVRLGSGVVVNAPIVADEYHAIDRIVSLDVAAGRAVLRLARGYGSGRHVWYISTDASDATVAAFERSTYAPVLASAPRVASVAAGSARFGILVVANGDTDVTSPDRQGMQSALRSGLSPLNVLQAAPLPGDTVYTPAWDLHLVAWTTAAIAAGRRAKVITWDAARVYAARGDLVSDTPGDAHNAALGGLVAAGIVVNCPVMLTSSREP